MTGRLALVPVIPRDLGSTMYVVKIVLLIEHLAGKSGC